MRHERKGKGQYKNIHRRCVKKRNLTVPFLDQGKNKTDIFFIFEKGRCVLEKCRFYPIGGPWLDYKI